MAEYWKKKRLIELGRISAAKRNVPKPRIPLVTPKRSKEYYLFSEYRITISEYNMMLIRQRGRCKICFQKMSTPNVDHCHNTDKVRGLLCRHCNSGLGFFKDNVDSLKSAISYLQI